MDQNSLFWIALYWGLSACFFMNYAANKKKMNVLAAIFLIVISGFWPVVGLSMMIDWIIKQFR